MKLTTLTIAASVSCLLLPTSGEAQVEVQILDAPSSAYSYEPIYVTYEVRNQGSEAIVVPADPLPPQGVFLKIGQRGEPLQTYHTISDNQPSRLVWLSPGDRWLFFQPVQLGPAGEFEVQAVLRSPGECVGLPVGPNKHRIEASRPIEFGSRPYDCWSGEQESQRILVTVDIPRDDVDLAAAESIQLDLGGTNWNALKIHFADLYKKFPTSHLTYAAFAFNGRGTSMLNAVILQPDNALNRWVAAAMAQDVAYRNRPCAAASSWGPGAPADLDERIERVIAAYPPPEPVQAYLAQLELEYAAEECPQKEGKLTNDAEQVATHD